MLTGTLNKIREEQANRMYDVNYIREMVADDAVDDRMLDLEMRTVKEYGNVFAEAAETVSKIPTDDSFRKEEVSRILNSDRVLSFDEILGITDEE